MLENPQQKTSRLKSRKAISRDFLAYGTVGAFGAAVHFTLLAILVDRLAMPFLPSHAGVTVAVMMLNFVLNNRFTYPARRLFGRAFYIGLSRFCLISAMGALINVAAAFCVHLLVPVWQVATFAGIAAGTFWNFFLSRRFTWKS